jgi:uncharacterized protein YdcH (DUF465 family)
MTDHLVEFGPVLLRESQEFRQLYEEHRTHEVRLAQLQSRHILNDEEQREEIELKKRKLLLKDRMAEIARQYREPVGS